MKNTVCRGRRPRRPTKRIISLFLSFIMLSSITAGLDFSAYALESSGSCGNNITWTFDSSTGTLTISGTGAMNNYSSNASNRSPFYSKTEIKKVIINSSVTSIGNNAFDDCTNLTSITIPSSVTNIGRATFYWCIGLESIIIPDSVTSIGAYAFEGCGLISVSLPNNITSIDERVFASCESLTSIAISDNIKTIGNSAFYNCDLLASVTIPDSVTSIGESAFGGCDGLKNVYYKGSETKWNEVHIGSDNDYLLNASIIYNANGTNCNHTYNNGTITTQPTCTKTGVKKSTCTVCGTTKTETVPALGHNYIERVARTATCTESGIKTYTCSRCNNSYTATVSALGHNYKTTVKKATPKEGGYSYTFCTRCVDAHYKYIPQVYAKLSKTSYYYDGKAKKPKVIVYNENGSTLSNEIYDVIYPKGRKKTGKYTVKIVFKGAYYSGTIKKTFKIVKKVKKPAQVKGVKATVLIDNDNSTVPFNVKWKKVKGASGYQMKFGIEDVGEKYWSGTKTFKGASNTTFNTMLLYGTDIFASKYGCSFLKIRAYKKVNGKKVYGKWSKIVNCKTYEKTNGKAKEKLY